MRSASPSRQTYFDPDLELTWVKGNSTASLISCFWLSRPPTSEYLTSGFSSAPNMEILLSASGGKISTRAFE